MSWNKARDIAQLRAEIPALASLSDNAVEGLYSWWSEESNSAGWLMVGARNAAFAKWVGDVRTPEPSLAVDGEREAIAKLVEGWYGENTREAIAAAIRARGGS